MMKKTIALFVFGSLFLAGCPKHEIIPAPTTKIDLNSTFIGNINGSDVELTQNVDGYYLDATKVKAIVPSPDLSSSIYSADMKSDQTLVSIKVSLGSVMFDGSISQDPTINQFNSFYSTNTAPIYTTDAEDGFAVTYRDGNGGIWKTDPTMSGGNVLFTNIVQESDDTGDYSKFSCNFDCIVYRYINDTTTYSLPITGATLNAWFKR